MMVQAERSSATERLRQEVRQNSRGWGGLRVYSRLFTAVVMGESADLRP
jgi:hypothetical protein